MIFLRINFLCLTLNPNEERYLHLNAEAVTALHLKEYGTQPRVTASAPGKINLGGDFSEPFHGILLSAAINLRVYIAISARQDGLVRFYSREYNERKKTSITNLKFRKEDRWANYPKGALAHFYQLGFETSGIDLTIAGDIPQGIGLASSQALTMASLLAFNEFFGAGQSIKQLIQAAHRTETAFLGQNPGMSAYLVQGFAEAGRLFYLDARSLDFHTLPFAWTGDLAVINSHVPGSSFDFSARRSREASESCLKLMTQDRPGKSLRDLTKADLREKVGEVPESSRRRCLHLVEENHRVTEIHDFLQGHDFAAAGKIMNRSHESLRDLYEVSCPEIDWLVKRFQEVPGVAGARMTGEDSGGCVVSLFGPETVARLKPHLEEYERIFGFKAEIRLCRPDAAARVETTS